MCGKIVIILCLSKAVQYCFRKVEQDSTSDTKTKQKQYRLKKLIIRVDVTESVYVHV